MTFWIRGSNCSETWKRGVSSEIVCSACGNSTRSAISDEGGEDTEIEGEASLRIAGEGGGDSMVTGVGLVAAAIDILSIGVVS